MKFTFYGESASKTTQWKWQNIHSIGAAGKVINIKLVDKGVFLLPKRFFESDDQIIDFLGIVQAGIHAPKARLVKKVGDKYALFSSGEDGIPNTKDDLFPQLPTRDTSRFGLLQRR